MCPHPPNSCALSHVPSPHRSPHCTHFPHCRLGVDCPYTHVAVSRDAPVCRDFVEYGWCDKGEHCAERHAFECPDFAESGTCTRKGCKLPHVLRRRNGGKEEVRGVQEAGEGERVRVQVVGAKRDRDEGEDEREGISGARGRALKKAREEANMEEGADFVMFPVSDDEFEEDDEDDDENADDDDDEEGEGGDDGGADELNEADYDLESISSFDDDADDAVEAGTSGSPSARGEPEPPAESDDSESDEDGAVASLLVR